MPGEPAEVLMGVGAMGLGALLAYGAYRDVPVFGPEGLLTGALRQGKLQPVSGKKAATVQGFAQKQPNVPWYAPSSIWNFFGLPKSWEGKG